MPAPKSSIDLATKLGAKFEMKNKEWYAVLSMRGRAVPLVSVIGSTKEEAATRFVVYLQKGRA